MYNNTLQQQLQKQFGNIENIPDNLLPLFEMINKSYDHYDKDHSLMEQFVEQSSKKMTGLNRQLKKNAKEELEKAYLQLKTTLIRSNEVLFAVDMLSLELLDISGGCEKVYGYTPEEFYADRRLWEKLIHTEDKQKAKQYIETLFKGKELISQYRIIHKDDSIRWIENKIMPTFNSMGRLIRMDGVTYDITERKSAEKEIEEAGSLLEAILDSSADGILVVDLNGKIQRCNNKFLELWSIPPELLDTCEDENAIAFVTNQMSSPEEFLAKVRELYGNKHSKSFDVLYLKDGQVFEGYSVPQLICNQLVGRVWSFRDITKQKQAEDTIKQSELNYRSIFERATDAICIADVSLRFLDMNPYACQILGYSKKEALQLFVTDIIFPEDLVTNPISKFGTLKTKETIRNERRFKRKDGTSITMAVSTQLMDDGRFIMFGHDISERKKAEMVLKESEGQLAIASQIAKLGYWEFGVMNNQFKFNDQFYSIFKTTVEQVGSYFMPSEQYADNFIHPDDIPKVIQAASDAIKSSDPEYNKQIEYRIKYANGEIGYLAARYFILKNELGRTVKIYGAIQDITENKKAEEALINNELRFRTLTSNAPVGIFQTDVIGKTIYVNETWLKYTGMEINEALGEGWLTTIHPEDREKLKNDWAYKSQNGLKSSAEYRLADKKGNMKWVSGEAIPLFNNAGEITGYIGTVSDITERKDAESVLKKSEGQLSIATQIAKLGYWEFDVINNMFTFNDQFYSIFKTTADQVGGYTMSPGEYSGLFVHPDDISIVTNEVADAINSPDPNHSRQVEHRIIYANGEAGYMAVRFFIIKNKQGQTIKTYGANQDITERKKAEETLRISDANLELKNKELELKNKELEQFAYVASHDLQEPLRTTSSFVELLQQQYKGKLDSKADKYLTFISQSSDRMKSLINDLLEYSSIGRKKELAKVDCNIILDEVLADLGSAIIETGAVINSERLPVVNGYATEIKQLFQNLVFNAVKFRKKTITPEISISVQQTNDFWQFAIKDNGIGIEEQHSERIFVIFQRLHTRKEYEGSGIGLSHCKKIVELHNGSIWVKPEPNEGTTFYFTIPVASVSANNASAIKT